MTVLNDNKSCRLIDGLLIQKLETRSRIGLKSRLSGFVKLFSE
jgi:hypothetical protein